MPAISHKAQKVLMQQLSSIQLQSSDVWEYAVATNWLDKWKQNVSQSSESTSKTVNQSIEMETSGFDSWEKTESIPRRDCDMLKSTDAFSMVSIEKGRESLTSETNVLSLSPMTMSENDEKNTYLSETKWKIFTSWFGIDKNHQLRRRPVSFWYINIEPENPGFGERVLCDNQLDFMAIWVSRLSDMVESTDNSSVMSVFAWESFDYVGKQIRRVLNVKKYAKVRFWLSIKQKDRVLALEPILDGEELLLCKVASVVPDLKKVMAKRQVQASRKFHRGDEENTNLRRHLSDDWPGKKLISVSIGIEEFGIDMSSSGAAVDVFGNVGQDIDDDIDSIVTISSIKNEWDDILATYVDKYTEEMNMNTSNMKEELMKTSRHIVGEKLDAIAEIRSDFEKRFALLEQRESNVKGKERELKEREEEVAKRLGIFKVGLDDFQRQKKKLAEDMSRIESQNKISESKVSLNIGGHMFTTSVDTLTKEADSLLALMFSGRHAVKREPDGSFFVDRDGTHFRYVLNYLRDGDVMVETVPSELKLMKELVMEAKYYRLPKMVERLENKMAAVQDGAFARQDSGSMGYQSFD